MQITQIYLTDHGQEPRGLLHSFRQSVQRAFHGAPYVLYKNQEADAFLEENFDNRTISAYKKLIPFAYKADLLRQCILFIKGGWYVDIGMYCPLPVPKFDKRIDLVAFREEPRLTPSSSWSVANGVIYAKPGHPVLKRTIDSIVHHCEVNYYGHTPLCPTGPTLWGRSLCEEGIQSTTFYGDFIDLTPLHETRNRAMVLPNGRIIALYKPNQSHEVRQTLSSLGGEGTNNFADLWQQRRVYNSP